MMLLVLRDLRHRIWHVLLSVLLIAVVMTLLFVMTGLVNQFRLEPFESAHRIGEDRSWIVGADSGGPFSGSQPLLLSAIAPVTDTGFLLGRARIGDQQVTIVARTFDGFEEPMLNSGRFPDAANEVVVDESLGIDPPASVVINGHEAVVVGRTSNATIGGGGPLVFTDLVFGQRLVAGGQPLVSGGLIVGPPETLPEGLRSMTTEQVGEDGLGLMEDPLGSISIVQMLLWLVTFVVTATTVSVSVLERTRDFAVLKAVGASERSLAVLVVAQAVVMALLAVGLAAILQTLIAPLFPMLVRVPSSAVWQMPLGAVGVAMVAAAAGVWKVLNTPAAEAFG